LPELAKGFGQSIRTFKEELTKEEDTATVDAGKSTEKRDSETQAEPAKSKKE